jgi:hypothetical protein
MILRIVDGLYRSHEEKGIMSSNISAYVIRNLTLDLSKCVDSVIDNINAIE